jgi:hypothetical protein
MTKGQKMKTRKEIANEAITALENIAAMLAAGEIDEHTAAMRRSAILLILSQN